MIKNMNYETISTMSYKTFEDIFSMEVLPTWEKKTDTTEITNLVFNDGMHTDFMDWLYFNRHLLEYLTIEETKPLAPHFYAYEKNLYLVKFEMNELVYKPFVFETVPMRRQKHITEEEMEKIKEDIELAKKDPWKGPFDVSPELCKNKSLVQEYFMECYYDIPFL